jgi:uncharacterized Fe-S cluster protein YjdI
MDLNDVSKEYSNGEITVIWKPAKSIHSGNCARNLPEVFRPKEHPLDKSGECFRQCHY